MAKIEFVQGENADEMIIKVTGLNLPGKPSSTGKSEVRGFGTQKVVASDGSQVVLGLNCYVRS
jgi:hypothetical protein